jgi:phosphatidylserine decarboxylase
VGERVERGERVGLIKFGSRCDVWLPPEAQLAVRVGDRVMGGSSILGALPPAPAERVDRPGRCETGIPEESPR